MKDIFRKRWFAFLLIIPLFVMFQGCEEEDSPNNPDPTPSTNQIIMQGNNYSPATKTVAVGTSITWINRDGWAHTVTSGTPGSPDGKFNSGNIGGGGSYSFTFTTTGTYTYYCSLHPNMTATITVQ